LLLGGPEGKVKKKSDGKEKKSSRRALKKWPRSRTGRRGVREWDSTTAGKET